jgi:hypothetical protein
MLDSLEGETWTWRAAKLIALTIGMVVAAILLWQLVQVVSRMLWKFPGGALRACEGLGSQAARSRGMGAKGCDRVSQPSILRIWI